MKNLKKTLACLLSVAMIAAMGALSASADTITVEAEAETNVLSGTAAVVTTPTAGEDVSGGAFVGSLGGTDAATKGFVEFKVNVDAAGDYDLVVGYVCLNSRFVSVSVNGGASVYVGCPGNNTDWNSGLLESAATTVTLNAGENSILVGNDKTEEVGSDSPCWAPNVDYIKLTAAAAEAPEATPDAPEATPDAPEATPDAPEATPDAPADEVPETGDATIFAVVAAVVALAGAAVVSKKRHTAE